MTDDHAGEQLRKRGRRARRPDPADGPCAAFAHALLVLKETAGDPSYDRMRAEYGAMASKSALSAAARGDVLPSWETTWEFVRSLAVTANGDDEEEARRAWRARWDAVRVGPAKEDGVELVAPVRTPRGRVLVAAAAVLVAVGVVVAVTTSWSGGAVGGTGTEQSLPIPGDASRLVADVTYPDGSVVTVDQRFVKTWQLNDAGTVPWHGRYLQRLPPLDGLDICHTDARVPIPDAEPGANVLVNVPVEARGTPGSCKVFWKMVDAGGRLFLPQSTGIYFQVNVVDRAPTG